MKKVALKIMKQKLHKYIVRLPDGKEVMVKAHDRRVGTFKDSHSPATLLEFLKNDQPIMSFKEWIFWRKL